MKKKFYENIIVNNTFKYMIDLHKHLRKYEILQTPFRPRFGYKYCVLQKAKLEDQVLHDKDTGHIIKTYDKEKNILDSICKT